MIFSKEVEEALERGGAVVALESTIVSHGMPYPENVRTALEVEEEVRKAGAVPATIAVLDGKVHVGLSRSELERVGKAGPRAQKASVRDLGVVLARGEGSIGSTTVAATAMLARRAGIDVFATGGLGGVHRGGESSMDVSADLHTLASTAVLVVCAGVKSLLDIGRTLEVLETYGVLAAALGQDAFPAFFVRDSGRRAAARFESVREAVAAFEAGREVGHRGAVVLGVPVPGEAEADGARVEAAISRALAEAEARGVSGRDVTPFLLARVAELTDGASLATNVALIRQNARVAAEAACELRRLRRGGGARVLVVGAAAVDVLADAHGGGEKAAGSVHVAPGGVARNVAEAVARLGVRDVALMAAVSRDALGQLIVDGLRESGVRTDLLLRPPHDAPPNVHVAIAGAASISSMETAALLDAAWVWRHIDAVADARAVVVDANLPVDALRILLVAARDRPLLWLEATSATKCLRLREAGAFSPPASKPRATVALAANEAELRALLACDKRGLDDRRVVDFMRTSGLSFLLLTRGPRGATFFYDYGSRSVSAVPPPRSRKVVPFTTTGAGDCMSAIFLKAILTDGMDLDWKDILHQALHLAQLSISDNTSAIPSNL